MMQALPAALSVACGPGQESWWPPTTTKSSRAALDLADRDLHGAPAVLDVGAEPHAHRPRLQHLAQLQAGRAGDADAGQRRHLGLVGLGRRIAPHRLHRAERDGRVLGMAPVHHHAAGGAHDGGDALLLVARRVVGELGERDLAGCVAALVFAEGAGGDVDQLGRHAVGKRRQAVAQRVGLDRRARPAPALASRPARESSTSPGISCTRADTPALVSAAALYSAMRLPLAEPARRDGISVVMCSTWAFDVGRRHRVDDDFIRHASSSHPLQALRSRAITESLQGWHLAANFAALSRAAHMPRQAGKWRRIQARAARSRLRSDHARRSCAGR